MSRIGVSLIKFGNRIFKPVRHPFNLADSGEMSYAEWQYEKGMDTVACYAPKYKTYDMFEDKTVLDMGCGAAGKSLYYVSQGASRVVGVDIVQRYEREAEELAKKLGYEKKFSFVCASAFDLPFPDQSFDTIIMNDAMSEEPPEEMNGSGLPVVGNTPIAQPMFRNAWNTMTVANELHTMRPNKLVEVRPMRKAANRNATNSTITAMAPTRPNSSPTMAKMKSL